LQHFKNSIDRVLGFAHAAIISDVDRIADLPPSREDVIPTKSGRKLNSDPLPDRPQI
jgi:hypothetical protein